MNPGDNDKQDKQQLRAAAEANLAQRPPGVALGGDDAQRLLHELQVHQVELEMQNESLRKSQIEMETASLTKRPKTLIRSLAWQVASP